MASGTECISGSGVTLNAMSYNIQGLPGWASPAASLRVRRNFAADFLRDMVKKYKIEVLVLQELFDHGLYKNISSSFWNLLPYTTGKMGTCKSLGWNTSVKKSGLSLHILDGGICIFSEHPIEEKHRLIFSDGVPKDSFSGKGAVMAKVKKDETEFYIVGTHLQSGSGKRYNAVRKNQMMEMLLWIKGLAESKVNAILPYKVDIGAGMIIAGDFNVCLVNESSDFWDLFNLCNGIIDLRLAFGVSEPQPTFDTETNDFCALQNPNYPYKHVFDLFLVTPELELVNPQTVAEDLPFAPLVAGVCMCRFWKSYKKPIRNFSDHKPIYIIIRRS